MDIRRAALSEAPIAESILREAANWLEASGRKLWDQSEISSEQVAQRAQAGELVVGFDGAEAAACMYLQNQDPVFWPHAIPDEALYVHRLAVRRAHAGGGWGRRLLDWAVSEAQGLGRAFVRLDSEPRPKLLALYENSGFRRVDRVPLLMGGHEVVRFERPVLRRI